MGLVPSNYINEYQGLLIPTDERLPWNPWSTNGFQFQWNKDNTSWKPWNFFCFENRNNENLLNSHLFVDHECFSPTSGKLSEIQAKSAGFVTDQSMTSKWNRQKTNERFNSPMDGFSRTKSRKNRKRNRAKHVFKQTDNTSNSSLESRQQSYQRWNHVPVLDWSQSNLPPRSAETIFQNPFRSKSVNEYSKNLVRSHNSARSAARNFSGTTSGAAASRASFKSDNNSTKGIGNAISKNLSGTMNKKIMKVNSAPSNNSKNLKEDDDVIYLFSVDSSSEGKMVLEIDLQSDGLNLIHSNSPSNAQKSKNEDDQSIVIMEELELNRPMTRKRKLSASNDNTNKRPSYRPRCAACKRSYDDVTAKKQNLYISSSCSHVFCGSCISKDKKLKDCPACNIKFLNFRRLYV